MSRSLKRAAVVTCLFAAVAAAQMSTSVITGTVTDRSGAVVPGAAVTAANEATGVAYKQTTTDTGLFAFPALPAGSYTITVELKGFKTSRRTGNLLEVNTPLTVNVSIEVGETSEIINVEGAYERLQTTNAALGNVVDHKAVVELPLNGRNPLNLLVLEPGVLQRSGQAAGTTGVNVNGARDKAVNVTIDGIEANESSNPNPLNPNTFRMNPDAVQEFKVTTNNPTPEEGRNSGASVSIATRTGTNEFHGSVFEFFRNTVLNANEFFANAQDTPKPDMKMNQYGFELGGPVKKNRTFFFGSWQGLKLNVAQPIDQIYGVPVVYTPSALSGVFRYFVADPANPFVLDGVRITRNSPLLVDTATGALRPGVRTCASPTDANCVSSYNMFQNDPRKIGLDPVIGKLFKSYPAPNNFSKGDGLNTAAYLWNPAYRVRGPQWMVRIDHTFNANNMLFARYIASDQDTLDGDPNNSRPRLFPGWPPMGEVFRRSKNFALSYRKVISPRVVNEFTMGFSRFVFLFTQGEANPTFPDMPPFSFGNVDKPFLNTPRTFRAVTTPQFLDNLSVIRGSHVMRVGGNVRMYEHNDQRGQPGGVNVTPTLVFTQSIRPPAGFNTPAVAGPGRPGIDATDSNNLLQSINELMGIPARLTQVFLGDLQSDQFMPFRAGNSVSMWVQGHRLKSYHFYFQDEWRIRQNLTVNYGARWEINPAPSEAAGRVYVPDKPIDGSQGPVTFVKAKRWFQRNNVGAIGPRFGVTWSPDHKTVLRSGYGIAFDPIASFQVTAVSGRVPGLTTTCSVTVGGAPAAGCAGLPDKRIGEGFPLELPAPTTKPSSFLTLPAQLYTNAPAITTFDPSLKMPTVHQWNLTLQRELRWGFIAQASYVGRRGTRLFRSYDLNQVNADPILPSFRIMQQNVAQRCRADGTGCPAGATGQAVPIVTSGVTTSTFVNSSTTASDLATNGAGNFAGRLEQSTLAARLRRNQQFAAITYLDSGGDSYYHSGQFTLRKRFQAGVQMGLAYTFGKSIDDMSVDPVGSTTGGGIASSSGLPNSTTSRAPIDIRNWRNERARSDYDRRHAFTATMMLELPVGKGKRFGGNLPGALNHVVGGWSLNTIYAAASGEPFTPRSGSRTSNYSHESRAALSGPKPEPKLQEISGVVGPVFFRDASGFVIPEPGENGIGRNVFVGPGYWNLDFGLHKRFDLTERIKLQFRTELFNALNHSNFDNPRDATGGSLSIRSSVFAQTCCSTVAPSSTQNVIQTGESGRVIQLALRLQF